VQKITKADFSPIMNNYSDELKNIVYQMLVLEPSDRASIKNLYNNPLFPHFEFFTEPYDFYWLEMRYKYSSSIEQNLDKGIENFKHSTESIMQCLNQNPSSEICSKGNCQSKTPSEVTITFNSDNFQGLVEYGKALENCLNEEQNRKEIMENFKIALQYETAESGRHYKRALQNQFWGKIEIEHQFLKQLADSGNEKVILFYGKCLESGTFGEPNLQESIYYFRKAVQLEIFVNFESYKKALENLDLKKEELEIEHQFLKQLANSGNKEAILFYGQCLESGIFGEPNFPESIKYF
jgi:hypothetical protein